MFIKTIPLKRKSIPPRSPASQIAEGGKNNIVKTPKNNWNNDKINAEALTLNNERPLKANAFVVRLSIIKYIPRREITGMILKKEENNRINPVINKIIPEIILSKKYPA